LITFAQEHDLKIGTIADLIHFRSLNEKTVTKIDQYKVPTQFGEFDLHLYQDTIFGHTHMALTMGTADPDHAVLVRVHVPDILRDVLNAQSDTPKWTVDAVMQRIAEEGKGVLVILGQGEVDTMLGSIDSYYHPERQARPPFTTGSGAYLTVGTGSQILRDLGVGKMRLFSPEMKFNAISGFDLQIEEYIECDA